MDTTDKKSFRESCYHWGNPQREQRIRRKYRKGMVIRSLDTVAKEEFIYLNDKITNRGWFISLQLNTVLNFLNRGRICEAILCPRRYDSICERCVDRMSCPFEREKKEKTNE